MQYKIMENKRYNTGVAGHRTAKLGTTDAGLEQQIRKWGKSRVRCNVII